MLSRRLLPAGLFHAYLHLGRRPMSPGTYAKPLALDELRKATSWSRLEMTRQRSHRIEVTGYSWTNKTYFH